MRLTIRVSSIIYGGRLVKILISAIRLSVASTVLLLRSRFVYLTYHNSTKGVGERPLRTSVRSTVMNF